MIKNLLKFIENNKITDFIGKINRKKQLMV